MKNNVFVCNVCGYKDSSYIPMLNREFIKCPSCKNKVELIIENKIKAITLKEYGELLVYIDENHSFAKKRGKMIKSVSHTFDMHTKKILSVSLEDVTFSVDGNYIGNKLIDVIYDYLDF